MFHPRSLEDRISSHPSRMFLWTVENNHLSISKITRKTDVQLCGSSVMAMREAQTVSTYGTDITVTDIYCCLQILRGNDAPDGPSSDWSVRCVLHQPPGYTSTFEQFQSSRGKRRWGRQHLQPHSHSDQHQLFPRTPNHTCQPHRGGNWLSESGRELSGGEHAPYTGGRLFHSSCPADHLWSNFHEPQAQSQCLLPFIIPLQNVCGPQGQNRRC